MLIVLLLLAGAAVNIAVAVAFSLKAWDGSTHFLAGQVKTSDGPPASFSAAVDFGRTIVAQDLAFPAGAPVPPDQKLSFGQLRRHVPALARYYPPMPGTAAWGAGVSRATEIGCGWPMRSLHGTVYGVFNTKYVTLDGLIEAPPSWSWSFGGPSAFVPGSQLIPAQPLWLGFAVNTLLYAAVVWTLCGGPRALRRSRRARRRQCLACGYPVGTSAVCTECGVKIHHGAHGAHGEARRGAEG